MYVWNLREGNDCSPPNALRFTVHGAGEEDVRACIAEVLLEHWVYGLVIQLDLARR